MGAMKYFGHILMGHEAFFKTFDGPRNTQLAHDVVATLGFGCILVATSDNVVTTLSQHCVSDPTTTTKN